MYIKWLRDFPGGPVVKNLPCSAGDTGSIPGQGTKIPHAALQHGWVLQLLSPHTTTRVTAHHNKRSYMMQQRSCLLQLRAEEAK